MFRLWAGVAPARFPCLKIATSAPFSQPLAIVGCLMAWGVIIWYVDLDTNSATAQPIERSGVLGTNR